MPIFAFVVKDKSGRIHRGRAQADNVNSLTKRLQQSGYWVTQVITLQDAANNSSLGDGGILFEEQPPAELSDYWKQELQSDGSLRLIATSIGKHASASCVLTFAVLWNIVILLGIACALGFVPIDYNSPETNFSPDNPVFNLLLLSPGILIGIFFLYWALWPLYSHEEWHISHNRFEMHRRWRFLKRGKVECIINSKLEMQQRKDTDGNVSWNLFVSPVGNSSILRKRLLFSAPSKGELGAMQELANTLSKHTGWKIISTSDDE